MFVAIEVLFGVNLSISKIDDNHWFVQSGMSTTPDVVSSPPLVLNTFKSIDNMIKHWGLYEFNSPTPIA